MADVTLELKQKALAIYRQIDEDWAERISKILDVALPPAAQL